MTAPADRHLPTRMRAFVLPQTVTEESGPQSLYSVELPLPTPGAEEILVKIYAVSLNYRDILISRGRYPGKTTQASENDGVIPTSDAAGEVVAVGSNVDTFHVGDKVQTLFAPLWQSGYYEPDFRIHAWGTMINGCLAEYVCNRANSFVAMPKGLSFEEASTIPCAAVTAYHALFNYSSGSEPSIKNLEGRSVLVQGTGGVSIFGAQLAVALGAERVIVTSSSDEKLERVRKLIPSVKEEDTINYATTPKWGEEVQRRTNGQGVNHIIEIGGLGTLLNSIDGASVGGQIHIIGTRAGKAKVEDAQQIGSTLTFTSIYKNIKTRGVFVGSRPMHEELNDIISAKGIKPVIDSVFDFDDAVKAFEYLEAGSQFGKIVIRVAQSL